MTSQNKDCRTCGNRCLIDEDFALGAVVICTYSKQDPRVKRWRKRHWWLQYDEIIEPCPGWEEKVNDKSK